MNLEKSFLFISIIAFLSLTYIIVETLGFSNYVVNNLATVSTNNLTENYVIPPDAPENYKDNKNGTITDNQTGLIWKKCPQGMYGNTCTGGSATQRVWSKSNTECEQLNFAGIKDWRMPTLKELNTLVYHNNPYKPSINEDFFVATEDPYWVSTSPAENPVSKFTVLFTNGSVYNIDMNNAAAVRCVYDGKIK